MSPFNIKKQEDRSLIIFDSPKFTQDLIAKISQDLILPEETVEMLENMVKYNENVIIWDAG